MIIGIPRETKREEHRVGLTPYATERLVRAGHQVLVEKDAGSTARFSDPEYEQAGAQVVYSNEEVYLRADIVSRVGSIAPDEVEILNPETVVTAFHHLAVTPVEQVKQMMDSEVTLIGYEVIEDGLGGHPILDPISDMAGQMALHVAAHYLQNDVDGRGILLGSVPGIPPPTVLILGAGTAGRAAARNALAVGAQVIVLDKDLERLRWLNREVGAGVVTMVAGEERLARFTAVADVLIGAVLDPGGPAPHLVTESMVRNMKAGSVLIDLSIDQGGCVETSRPTTPDTPTYVVHDVVHYCVPNMTANIARTGSRALADAWLPILLEIGASGLAGALRSDPGLREGVYLYHGTLVNEKVGATLGLPATDLEALLPEER